MHPSTKRIIFAALFFLLMRDLEMFASLRPETRNRLHLDRYTCKILNPKVMKSFVCVAKHISMADLKLDTQFYFTRPLSRLWIHVIVYFKFNGIVYNKFPMDHWENICNFFDGKKEDAWFFDWWVSRLQKKNFTNFNHTCPYSSIIVKADNVTLDTFFSFTKGILPSGRYRIDIVFAEEDRIPFLDVKLYGTNAEHPLEKI